MSKDESIEEEIRAKGLTAPRITPADIEAEIASEDYFTAAQGASKVRGQYPLTPLELLTFCVLTLRNGFTVTGESACASPENFDAELGRKIARQNAVSKVWPLMGYALKQQLSEAPAKPKYSLADVADVLYDTPTDYSGLSNTVNARVKFKDGQAFNGSAKESCLQHLRRNEVLSLHREAVLDAIANANKAAS